MKWHTPTFWYRDEASAPPLLETALTPLACLYQLIHRINMHIQKQGQYQSSSFVICVGNITAGGTGKTPSAAAIMTLIKKKNLFKCPCFLMRGYGGSLKEPTLVTNHHTAYQVGDEAFILQQHAPVIVCADRKKGIKFIEDQGFDCVVMDDGLQNNTVFKDFSILVVNAEKGFGNHKTIPAGPLREPIRAIKDDIDLTIWNGKAKKTQRDKAPSPFVEARIHVDKKIASTLKQKKILAFAGIAHPDKFFSTLRDLNLAISKHVSFPDHHNFSDQDLEKLLSNAKKNDLTLVTTEKDYVRLPDQFKKNVSFLPISLSFSDDEILCDLIQQKRDSRS